jgi:formylglycine-generating enzyme required for sulfatase activity
LQTAVSDARAVEETLTKEYGFRAENVTRLHNAQATATAIVGTLKKLAKQVQPDDSLFIFYAGHGQRDEVLETGAWVPVEGKRDDPTTLVQNATIKAAVRAMKARHVLLASDSCFAGDFFRGSRGALPEITPEYVRRAFGKTSRQALTSGGLEPVSDAGAEGHSVFTYFFLKTLRENSSPYLLPTELFDRIRKGVAANARQNPQLGILQDTNAELDGEFVFLRKGLANVLDEALKKKQEQMTALEKMQEEARKAAANELALQQQKESELKALDAKIAAMQKKLGGGATVTGEDVLTQLAMLADQKSQQAAELERLRRQAEAEKRKREEEMVALRQQEKAMRVEAWKADWAKYQKVASSPHLSDEIKQQALRALQTKWPDQYQPPKVLDLGGGVKLELVWIPAGEFMMGSNDGDIDEKPVHKVKISRGFWMGKYEVTQEQYAAVMGKNPSTHKAGNKPVHEVSWHDAVAFCEKLGQGARLPTEAEWEYACRAGTTTKYSSGDDEADLQRVADYGRKYAEGPGEVGRKEANPWGLYDLHGNVWEWCADWYQDSYPSVPQTDPTGPASGTYRVLRGGSFDYVPGFCRCAFRNWHDPVLTLSVLGFRVVVGSGR